MIENVIFDIGGVLVDYHTDDYYRALGYSEEMAKKLADATMRSAWWDEYDRGVFEDAEIRGFFEEDAPELRDDIEKSLTSMPGIVTKRDTTLPWIREVRAAGRKVYYLSNFSETALRDCAEAMAFRSECDGGILSFEEQVIKPAPEIYQLLLTRYHLDPDRSVFLDDTRRNLPMAEYFGIHTIHVTSLGQAQRDLAALLQK
ncbi:MAG: HAD family phosphatase [Lachnospiraceae bacterium]|jgi:epoxide hydrolase-like predicted phosphatase|nr:HAD family phosphatase [Lachnospiraceae bacterium]MCI1423118.1 HAD family phosphatase [Lachnospiraceae bacterium]MCI1451982.1 HAD family phosphatase [Lachnospiraceae bacterium]MDD5849882.1 HAD family phosphatase [Bacillota bacterium]